MRILHIIDHMGEGGAQSIVKFFIRNSTSEFEHIAFSLRKTATNNPNIYSSRSKGINTLTKLQEVKSILVSTSPKVVHLHLNHAMLVAYLIQSFSRIKQNWIVHDHGEIYRTDLVGIGLRSIYRRMKNNCRFVAISEGIKLQLQQVLKNSKNIHLIKNIDFSTQSFPVQPNRTKFTFGFIARDHKRKNWNHLFEIARMMQDEENIQFLGIGKESKSNIPNLKMVIWQEGVDKLFNFDCLLILSKWEGFSLVQLEALSRGIPVIAWNVRGLNEPGEAAGVVYVDYENFETLQAKMNNIINDKELRKKLQDQAIQYSAQNSTAKYLKKFNELYESL